VMKFIEGRTEEEEKEELLKYIEGEISDMVRLNIYTEEELGGYREEKIRMMKNIKSYGGKKLGGNKEKETHISNTLLYY
jgi:hypothetical protein